MRALQGCYSSARWRRLRAWQLSQHPLCALCLQIGRTAEATVCDHVDPHRGDPVKFWSGPFQSLCQSCHSSHKQSAERTGRVRGVGVDGLPLDPNHHWNRRP